MHNITIITNGTIIERNTGKWSALIQEGTYEKTISGTAQADKNRIKLIPIANALSLIKEESCITVLTDSQFAANAFTRGWAASWKANGWTRNNNQKVTNKDVLEYILNSTKRHSVSFRWMQNEKSN